MLSYKISKHNQTFENEKIISCCLFYQENSKKDFLNIYYKGLFITIKLFQQFFPDWKIICYLDYDMFFVNDEIKNKIYEFLKMYINNENILINVYKFENNQKTMGSLSRFEPLFNDINYKAVFLIDVDNTEQIFNELYKNMIPYIDLFMNNDKIKVFTKNYALNLRFQSWLPKNLEFQFPAGFFISKIKFPKLLLTNFISAKNDYSYGVDELFLNNDLYNYMKKNSIKVLVVYTYTVGKLNGIQFCSKELDNFYKQPNIKQLFNKIKHYDKNYYKLSSTELIKYKEMMLKFSDEMSKLNINLNDVKEEHLCREKIKFVINELPNMFTPIDDSFFLMRVYF